IVRDMRNSVNRLVNCEIANLNKTIGAAMSQVDNIQFIDSEIGLEELPDRLREIARIRVEHQEVTLKELGDMMSTVAISNAGVKHRQRMLEILVKKLIDVEAVIV